MLASRLSTCEQCTCLATSQLMQQFDSWCRATVGNPSFKVLQPVMQQVKRLAHLFDFATASLRSMQPPRSPTY